MITTDHLTEEILSRHRQTGSLHNQLYLSPMGVEETEKSLATFFAGPRSSIQSTLTHRFSTSAEELGSQGLVTLNNFLLSSADVIVTASTYIAQWNQSQALDVRNIISSNFGQAIGNLLWVSESHAVLRSEEQQILPRSVLLSDEVLSYCSRYRVFNYLLRALKLAQESFLDLQTIEVETENDPETDDEWVVIVAHTHGEVRAILDWYDAYTREFIKAVPWPAQDRIRLVYDLV